MRKKIEVEVTGKVIGFAYDDETDEAATARIVLEAERHGNDGTSRIHLSMKRGVVLSESETTRKRRDRAVP